MQNKKMNLYTVNESAYTRVRHVKRRGKNALLLFAKVSDDIARCDCWLTNEITSGGKRCTACKGIYDWLREIRPNNRGVALFLLRAFI